MPITHATPSCKTRWCGWYAIALLEGEKQAKQREGALNKNHSNYIFITSVLIILVLHIPHIPAGYYFLIDDGDDEAKAFD